MPVSIGLVLSSISPDRHLVYLPFSPPPSNARRISPTRASPPVSFRRRRSSKTPASPHETRLDLVEKERSANSELLKDYPGHESLWCYRRFVCQALLVTAPHGTLVGKTTGATKETDAEQPPSSLTSCSSSKGHYDWAGWGRAVEEWHDRCVREDVKAAVVHDSDEEEEEEEAGGVEGSQDKGADFEAAEGALPGSPAGTGLLATFLGQEARFALDCATDKVCDCG